MWIEWGRRFDTCLPCSYLYIFKWFEENCLLIFYFVKPTKDSEVTHIAHQFGHVDFRPSI
jgi:hypothetical protein